METGKYLRRPLAKEEKVSLLECNLEEARLVKYTEALGLTRITRKLQSSSCYPSVRLSKLTRCVFVFLLDHQWVDTVRLDMTVYTGCHYKHVLAYSACLGGISS